MPQSTLIGTQRVSRPILHRRLIPRIARACRMVGYPCPRCGAVSYHPVEDVPRWIPERACHWCRTPD
jgi:hypothetical protein